jgi:hypothetical protein
VDRTVFQHRDVDHTPSLAKGTRNGYSFSARRVTERIPIENDSALAVQELVAESNDPLEPQEEEDAW